MRKFVRHAAGVWLAAYGMFAAHSAAQAAYPAEHAQQIGVQVDVGTFTESDAFQIKRTGFDFVRFGIWVNAMDEAAYRQNVADAFANARAAGLPVLATFRSTDALVSAGASASQQAEMLQAAGRALASTVLEVTNTSSNRLLAIELWNEPDIADFWPTGNVTQTFEPYMRAVCEALHAGSLHVPVIGFGLARPPELSATAAQLLEQLEPLTSCLDAVSYHAYDMTQQQVEAAKTDIRSHYRLPAFITEWGWSSVGANGPLLQAQEVASFLGWIRATGTPLVSIYEWKDAVSD